MRLASDAGTREGPVTLANIANGHTLLLPFALLAALVATVGAGVEQALVVKLRPLPKAVPPLFCATARK